MQDNAFSSLLDNLTLSVNSCGIYSCKNDWSIPERTIPDYDFFYIVKGKGSVVIDGQAFKAGARDLFLFSPGVPHAARHFPPANLKVLALHFSARVYRTWDLNEVFHFPPKFRIPAGSSFHALLKQAIKEKLGKNTGGGLAARSLVSLMLIELLRLQQGRNEYLQDVSRYHLTPRDISILEYIHRHISGRTDLETMANDLAMSTSLLHKTTKKCAGLSPVNLVNRIKVNMAQEMLRNNRGPVTEIAESLGFSDEAYFSRLFRKIAGLSPRKYRDSVLKDTI